MALSPIFESFYQDRSRSGQTDVCINLYPEHVDGRNGPEIGLLTSVPGLTAPVYTIGTGPIRCLYIGAHGSMYVVSGNSAYYVKPGGQATFIGKLATSIGPVKAVDGVTQVLFVDGTNAWCWNKQTNVWLAVIPNNTTDASGPVSVVYQDGFALVNSAATNQIYQSNYNDLSLFSTPVGGNLGSTANNAFVQINAQDVVAMYQIHDLVWIFKPYMAEIWINQGTSGFSFAQLQGVQPVSGCYAPNSIAQLGEGLCWFGCNNRGTAAVYMSEGYTARIISTHALTQLFQSFPVSSDAIAYSYQADAHEFYVITFPSANCTYAYDLMTGKWHQRAYFSNGSYQRELANCYCVFSGMNLVGDYRNGNIYQLSDDVFTDNGQPRRWSRSWRALPPSMPVGVPMSFDSLQILMETGFYQPLPPPVLPMAPQNLTAVGGAAEITTQWSTVANAVSYNLYWSNTPGAGTGGTKISGITTTTYVQTGLTNAAIYYYVVTAVNAAGESIPSNQASATPSGIYAYVANHNANTISLYSIDDTGQLSPLTPSTTATGNAPFNMAFSYSLNFGYVPNFSDNNISQYSIQPNGQLSALSPPTVASGNGAITVAIHPNNQYAYCVNDVDDTISQYAIQTNGQLSPLSPATVAGGSGLNYISITADGKYAYTTNFTGNTVGQYSIGSNGKLTALSPGTVAAGNGPNLPAISPNGQFLYVTNTNDNTVSQYSIGSDGKLTALSPATVATGSQPFYLAFTTDNSYCYVTNFADNNLSQYSIRPNGQLVPLVPATVATQTNPSWISILKNNKFAYCNNRVSNTISQFSIGINGQLTPLSPATVATGAEPVSISAY